ncbi:hypothetical protein B0T10DRAFT_562620 [Thelonectria olida]|uniref:Uncharacterized protein n=1 Tax=Thelonectria olida TaxID=1576542 RepID=A0A9P8W451_9HYPO|nr:hypothetical protein B0T10DRAFT_562620 [Thelonectria olida]
MGKGTGFDHVNNVEEVIWENVPESTFKIVLPVWNNIRPKDATAFAVGVGYSSFSEVEAHFGVGSRWKHVPRMLYSYSCLNDPTISQAHEPDTHIS